MRYEKEKKIGCSAYVKRVDIYKFYARSGLYKSIGYPMSSMWYYFDHSTRQKVFCQ